MIYISNGYILSAQFINFLSELIIKSLKKNTAETCLKQLKILKSPKSKTKTCLKQFKKQQVAKTKLLKLV